MKPTYSPTRTNPKQQKNGEKLTTKIRTVATRHDSTKTTQPRQIHPQSWHAATQHLNNPSLSRDTPRIFHSVVARCDSIKNTIPRTEFSPQMRKMFSPQHKNFAPHRRISPLKTKFSTYNTIHCHIYFNDTFIVHFFASQNFKKNSKTIK